MTTCAYAELLRPALKKHALLYDAALILAGSFAIALASQLAIYLPVSPVPITGQTLAVLLIGAIMGSKRGALSVLTYLGQGAMGLPVFAAGHTGFAYMAGPTGGYLFGFVAAAYAAGFFAERGWDRHIVSTLLAMVLGTVSIYLFGLAWLSVYVGINGAFITGLYPFIPGAIIKIAIAALILPSGWKFLGMKKSMK
ncbi:MAG: biotin transporter BioY [candidate division Zixibacteria bacterium]|nr:biotin transporter BioY [candidate division Zixibacteria bacterium]